MLPKHGIGEPAVSHYGIEQPPNCLESVFNSFKWTHLSLRGPRFIFIFGLRLSEEISYHAAVRIFPMTNQLIWTRASLHTSNGPSKGWILVFQQNFISQHLWCFSFSFLLLCVCFAGEPEITTHLVFIDWQAGMGSVSRKILSFSGDWAVCAGDLLCIFPQSSEVSWFCFTLRA